MGSIGKRKVTVSGKDLKQAILKKNKSLEAKNNSLKSSIKNKEKELKSLEKEYSSESKRFGNLIKDIEFQEGRLQKINGGIYSNEKLLSSNLKKVDKAEKELCGYEDAVEKLKEEESLLKKEIEALEFYKAKCSESKIELAGIQVKKDNALNSLKDIKNEISQLYVDHNSKVLTYKEEYDALEEKAQKHEDMVHQFEQRLIETQDLFKEEDNNLKGLLAKSKVEKENADNELQALKNLCNDTEDDYVKWKVKIDRATAKADKEEKRFKKIQENGKKYRLSLLEEVARLKLKSKIDKINKAGLSDVFDV
jgi:chromosome segregation ATPase